MNLRTLLSVWIVAALVSIVEPAMSENYPVILRGKVTMLDGSPPPIIVALERVCSDYQGSRPGPLTNKKGEYIWRMDVDPMRTRSCVIRATHAGYDSTSIDISALHGYMDTNVNLEPIVISSRTADPYAIIIPEAKVPLRSRSEFKDAMKAMDAGDYPEALRCFQAAVEAEAKFPLGWHALGVLAETQNNPQLAREAYKKALQYDPKLLPAHMTLLRLAIKSKDWEGAAAGAETLIKLDKKREYREAYLHQAVAFYWLKRLDEAAASAQEASRLDQYHQNPRVEYVLGRILEAKGDIEGARAHMTRYLELDKNAPDRELIRKHLELLGKAEAASVEPELEHL